MVNPLSAVLALAAILFYVFVYTLGLKRRTPSNIVWGGAAGCMPVLIGWAAVTDSLAWAPVILFVVIFFWTPPHYWPLSMRFRDDYSAAGVPMLPVVKGDVVVARRIVVYSWLDGRRPRCCCGRSRRPVRLRRRWRSCWVRCSSPRRTACCAPRRPALRDDVLRPMRLFHGSITYLTLLFLAVAIDPFVHLALLTRPPRDVGSEGRGTEHAS